LGTAQTLIAEAAKHVGYVEGKGKNNIFGKWYGANGGAWCAQFVSYCMFHSDNGPLIKGAQTAKGYAWCDNGVKHFKKNKAWFAVGKAQPGDIIFFDWNHDGGANHTGIVVKLDAKNKRVQTIEGNTSSKDHSNGGTVAKQWRNFSVVLGVGRPAYPVEAPVTPPVATVTVPNGAVTPVEPVVAPAPVVVAPPVVKAFTALKKGSKGSAVKAVQAKLKITADGDFGPITEKAVKAYQTKKGIVVTGVVNEETWKRLGL